MEETKKPETWLTAKPTPKLKVHRRYSDAADRPDLRSLACCQNISGPMPEVQLTSNPNEVTCGRCRRIRS